MAISRRTFLKISFATIGISAVSVYAYQNKESYLFPAGRRFKTWLVNPVLEDAPVGVLPDDVLPVLLAMTEALVGSPVEKSHYEKYFNWRSANLRGYKKIYTEFADELNRVSKKKFGCNYSESGLDDRHMMIEAHIPLKRIDKLRIGIIERDWIYYEKYIIHEAFTLYAVTDVWKELGYDSWPGKARGLTKYRKPISTSS